MAAEEAVPSGWIKFARHEGQNSLYCGGGTNYW